MRRATLSGVRCALVAAVWCGSCGANALAVELPATVSLRGARAEIYSEDFESFALGGVSGQFGWTGSLGAMIVDQSASYPSFSARTLEVVGSAIARVGYAVTPAPGRVEFDFVGEGSTFTPTDFHAFADIYVAGEPNISARILWHEDGQIYALQIAGGVSTFVNTGASWTPGTIDRYGLEALTGNLVRFYKNGSQIFSGHNVAIELGSIEEGVTNFQLIASPPTSTSHTIYIDNISAVDVADPADLDGNGTVGGEDLAILLASWSV